MRQQAGLTLRRWAVVVNDGRELWSPGAVTGLGRFRAGTGQVKGTIRPARLQHILVEGPGVGLGSGPNSTDEYRVSRCLGAKLLDVAVWDAFVAEWPAGHLFQTSPWGALRAKVGCTLASVAQSPRLLFLAATAL